jgi:hypothetical protein
MKASEFLTEKWSAKYKRSINCSHPRGFSQRAHCAGKNKHMESTEMEMVCKDCGMCQTHGHVMEIRKGEKDSNGYTRCWPGKHAEGTKTGKNGGQVRNCVPNESQVAAEGSQEINWVKPNFDFEWHEVEEQSRMKQVPVDVRQYYQKHFPNKDAWLKAVQNGKAVVVPPDHAYEIRNAPFDKASLQKVLAPTGHEGPIGPAKEKRVNDLFDKGQVEMPIILKTSQGLWLIGGKTRLGTANYVKGLPAKVWLIGGKQGMNEATGDERFDNIMSRIRQEPTIPMYQSIKDEITEAFDYPYKLKWEKSSYGEVDASATLDDGNDLNIFFNQDENQDGELVWNVEFDRNYSQAVTGEGDAQRVFATVLSAIQIFIKKYKPLKLAFGASKQVDRGQNSQSRARLYDSLVQRYARAWGYRVFRADTGNLVVYEFSRIQKPKAVGEDYNNRFAKQGVAEGTKLVADGSVINAYYNGIHIGNIFASNTKDTPYKAYSKHWDMSRLFKSKKAAAEWLAQTHQTAIKEEVHNPDMTEDLTEEFDLIESIVDRIAEQNGVDAEAVWEDLESLTEDELYAFAVTSQLNEDWQKANKQDRTAGMSQKAVNAYRREHPGSKLKTAVTTKPSKLKRGSKASKRRKSYCSRSRGQMKMHNISCAKTPDKAICKARRRWNC